MVNGQITNQYDPALSDDEERFLNLVPPGAPVGNMRLRQQLGWDSNLYFEVRSRLVARKLLAIGGGRGGSVYRPLSPASARPSDQFPQSTTAVVSILEHDQDQLLKLVPEDGSAVGNKSLRERLGWDASHYFEVRDRLVERKVLSRGSGRGGSVYRVKPVPLPKAAEEPAEPIARRYTREADLYAPVSEALREGWAKNLRKSSFLVQVTGKQGKRATGGMWTRPDITLVSVETYAYVPGKFLEVITYEIKPAGNWAVSGVFEAASHSRFATKTYLMIHAPGGADRIPLEQLERLQVECSRFEIGLGLFQDPSSYETYTFLVDPTRRAPDPEEMDRFITQQLSEVHKKLIVEWLR